MEELYFYYGVKMIKIAVENRTLNLLRKSGQQVSHFHNSKSICPKNSTISPEDIEFHDLQLWYYT